MVSKPSLPYVKRREVELLKTAPRWLLVYGRRKTGKTMMVRREVPWDLYVTVWRGGGGSIEWRRGEVRRIEDRRQIVDTVLKCLREDRCIVVDEFHRLPSTFLDELQAVYPSGKLFLLGSALHVVRKLVGPRSPLLGLVGELRISLIRPSDILTWVHQRTSAEEAVSLAAYLRDPWLIPLFKPNIDAFYQNVFTYARYAVSALIGEIFTEEERVLARSYETVLRAVARGYTRPTEIASILYRNQLIPRHDPAYARSYLRILEQMDLIRCIPDVKRGEYRYSIKSKIMEVFLYIEERYGEEWGISEGLKAARQRLPYNVEEFVGDLLAEALEATYCYASFGPKGEINIVLRQLRRPTLAVEVKWGRVRREDIKRAVTLARLLKLPLVLIVRQTPRYVPTEVTAVLEPDDLARIAQEVRRGKRFRIEDLI